jgi:hypothetical protein
VELSNFEIEELNEITSDIHSLSRRNSVSVRSSLALCGLRMET